MSGMHNTSIKIIDELIDKSIAIGTTEVIIECTEKICYHLKNNPDIINKFIENYLNSNADEPYVDRSLRVLKELGKTVYYDPKPLVNFINDHKQNISYRWEAIWCLFLLLNKLDESIVENILNSDNLDTRLSAIDKITIHLNKVQDKKKAYRIFKKCLESTDNVPISELGCPLDSFLQAFYFHEEFFNEIIHGNLKPHEKVIISLSFLREKWPKKSKYREIAESEAKKSKMAKLYLEKYIEIFAN